MKAEPTQGFYWLASYPKSGNTWLRIFLNNLLNDADEPIDINALDLNGGSSERTLLDFVLCIDTADLEAREVDDLKPLAYRWLNEFGATRFRKIHDANHVTRDGSQLACPESVLGALYVIRNPLDIAPAFAHHRARDIDDTIGVMGDPWFGLMESGPRLGRQVRQGLSSWSGHVRSWVDAIGPRLLVLRYEDMLAHPLETFTRAARFAGLPCDPARVERAIRFSDFEELARQETLQPFVERPPWGGRFFRRGQSGAWREELTDQQVRRLITDHGEVMRRFGYLDQQGQPL
ncbi:MAG: sulfotransferase domain-containing protein [Gammaproteobacteria bacterium]